MNKKIIKYYQVASWILAVLMFLFLILFIFCVLALQYKRTPNTSNGKAENEETHVTGKQEVVRVEESFQTSRRLPSDKISYQWKKSDSLCAHASTKELIELAKNHSDKM